MIFKFFSLLGLIFLFLVNSYSISSAGISSFDRGNFLKDNQSNNDIKLQQRIGDYTQFFTNALALTLILQKNDLVGLKQYSYTTLTNLGATYILKYSINRTRPNGGNHSFPSGHTSFTIAPVAFVHFRYGFKYAWPLYVATGFVGYSRVIARAHFISDIVAGAALGVLSAKYLSTTYQSTDGKIFYLKLIPSFNQEEYKLYFNINF